MVALLVFSSPGETLYRGTPQRLAVGNTWRVAQQLASRLGVAPTSIEPVAAYPLAYADLLRRAQGEQRRQALPALSPLPATVVAEPVWFLGFPLWFGEVPRPVMTLLRQVATEQRTVYPFVTHEGGGLGRTQAQLQAALPHAEIRPGLPVRGSRADRAGCAVDHWLTQYQQDLVKEGVFKNDRTK